MSCIGRQHLVVIHGVTTQSIQIRTPIPISLRQLGGGPSGLSMWLWIDAEIVQRDSEPIDRKWTVQLANYQMRLLDRFERELIVYHWMPGPLFLGPDHPHMHVSASFSAQIDANRVREIDLDRLHLPTGRLTVAALVRMLIAEFGVAPLRDDWRDILDRLDAELSV